MSGVGGFRGVSADQDVRYVNKTKKAMASMKFPKELDVKVDVKALRSKAASWLVIKEWIAKRVTQLLGGLEEEVLIGFIFNTLDDTDLVNPKEMHVSLVPFLEKNTSLFMRELWGMLASAATTESGLPQVLVDEKAKEFQQKREAELLMKARLDEQRAAAAAAAAASYPPPPPGGRSSRWEASEEARVKKESLPGPPGIKQEDERGRGGSRRSRSRSRSPQRDRRSRSRDRNDRSRDNGRGRDSGRDRDNGRDMRRPQRSPMRNGRRSRSRSPPRRSPPRGPPSGGRDERGRQPPARRISRSRSRSRSRDVRRSARSPEQRAQDYSDSGHSTDFEEAARKKAERKAEKKAKKAAKKSKKEKKEKKKQSKGSESGSERDDPGLLALKAKAEVAAAEVAKKRKLSPSPERS